MSSTIVWVTGVGRGIGRALVTAYLSRPNHIVIGSVRDAKASVVEELHSLPTAEGSRLLLVSIESTSRSDPAKAVEEVKAAGIDRVDIVIANSGISHPPAPLESVDPENFLEAFNVNAVGTIVLFQAVSGLLAKSTAPKWVSVSSRVGSVGDSVDFFSFAGPYGISKAAQNWFTSVLHASKPSLTVFAVHPGFVATDMGIAAATGAGIDLPVLSPEESASKLISVIDDASKDETSGKLIDVITGEKIVW